VVQALRAIWSCWQDGTPLDFAGALPELVKEMMAADYSSARRDSLVKSAGFQAYDYHE